MEITICNELKDSVKMAREHAYLGLYSESIKLFKKSVEKIELLLSSQSISSDSTLNSEWQKLKNILISEMQVTEELNQVVYGVKSSQQDYGSNNNNVLINKEQNQAQKQQQQKLPFGQKPFQFHQIQNMEENKSNQNQQNQIQQTQSENLNWNQQQQYNYQPSNNNKQNFQQPQQNSKANNYNSQERQYDDFFAREKNEPFKKNQEQKDPDVWDPPPAKPQNQKKKGSKQLQTQKSSNDPLKKRNYEKPWQNNAVNNQPENQEENKNDFLHHCYPDGKGPDANLISMLEKDILQANPNVKFDEIAELDEAKSLLQEAALLPLLMPEYFQGIRRPWKGILLFGPPGTGKTMLAKALATLGKTTFFNVHVSNLNSKWHGESEKLIRILFEMARFYSPSIIFFDEVDSIGTKRQEGDNEVNRKVKAELLVQMDGVSDNLAQAAEGGAVQEKKLVMVLAATNRPQDLDEALRRRLEKRIYIPLPSELGRRKLFDINLRNIKLADNIDWDLLVKKSDGFSGADVTNVCREAALLPMRRNFQKNQQNLLDKIYNKEQNVNNFDGFKEQIDVPITQEDLMQALKNTNKSVGKDDLEGYAKWMKEFGSV